MIKLASGISNVRMHDLYEAYPDFDIDVEREKELLLAHDVIIWQHPFYWYSAPAIIKQWMDLVLEHNWAYGHDGYMLQGKRIFNVISSGASKETYGRDGRNRLTIREFLAPFEHTASLCKMIYLPPFVIHGTHKLGITEIDQYADQYVQLLKGLTAERFVDNNVIGLSSLNELPMEDYIQS